MRTRPKPISRFSLLSLIFVHLLTVGCSEKRGRSLDALPAARPVIRALVDSAPATMNPRFSIDAIGQRLEMFPFRALTRLDANLEAKGDLAEDWAIEDAGKTYRFRIRRGLVDQENHPITAELIRVCFENYLQGEPRSPHRTSFPNWKATDVKGDDLRVLLSAPDPYLPRNLSVLRYFSVSGDPANPCREPKEKETLVGNGDYEIHPYPLRVETGIRFQARKPDAPDLEFLVVRDETSRIFKLLNGDADIAMNTFAPTKTDWIAAQQSQDFKIVAREGTNASYLAFNLDDPILGKLLVRQAIAHAIDRDLLVRSKIRGEAKVASSFLVGTLPEAIPAQTFAYDTGLSEKLLDEAGYPRGKDGVRLHIRYKSTTSKSGMEIAQIFREMLAKVGIAVDLDTVEPSVFFATISKGAFQMYMSQWVGVADGSIFHRTLHSGNHDNRVHYRNAEMDWWLDASIQEVDFEKRKALLAKIQMKMLEDLPYFPLWHWTNALVFRNTIAPPKGSDLSLSGSYTSFADLRFLK